MRTREPGKNPATRTFQALRMHINDELGQLRRALAGALELLAVGGRLAVISFHSLEDRAGQAVHPGAFDASTRCSRGLPVIPDSAQPRLQARRQQDARRRGGDSPRNPRARSSVLRVAEKVR